MTEGPSKGDVAFIAFLISIIVGAVVGVCYFFNSVTQSVQDMSDKWEAIKSNAIANYNTDVNNFKVNLQAQDYTVLGAHFDSPAITVDCPTLQDFYSRVNQLNTKTIYIANENSQAHMVTAKEKAGDKTVSFQLTPIGFYVIDETATYAYCYTIPFEG